MRRANQSVSVGTCACDITTSAFNAFPTDFSIAADLPRATLQKHPNSIDDTSIRYGAKRLILLQNIPVQIE